MSATDVPLIMSAMAFAAKCHTAQRRKYDHTPYINHPIRVAAMVAEHPVATTETVVAALLHDVIEDCPVSYNDIAAMNFGPRVPDLVLSLTERRTPGNRKQRILTECQRLSKESDETKIVKLCDRIDNVHDLKSHLVTKKISAGFCNIYVNESLQLVDFIGGADESLANVITEHCRDIKSVLDKIT